MYLPLTSCVYVIVNNLPLKLDHLYVICNYASMYTQVPYTLHFH